MQRRFDPGEPELMDRPQPVTAELVSDLRNLCQFNRYFGSYALITRFLQRWIKPEAHLRMLDLATGSGDIPRLVVNHARKVGARMSVLAIDQQSSTLEIARSFSVDFPEIEFRQGDVVSFEDDKQFDIVLCSLALHHFDESNAVKVLKRCRDLSRRFVLVADLRRGLLATVGVYLLTAFIYRESMTRYDARLSAARAFSFREFELLARRAGWTQFHHRKFRFARQAIWMEPPGI